MSKFTNLKNMLLKNVCKSLTSCGFDKKIYGQSFLKPINNGKAMIHLNFIKHSTDFDVTVSVSVRFDALEDMINNEMESHINKGKALLTNKEKYLTSTIGCELGNLIEGKQRRWNIIDESDVDNAAQSICETILKVALPYIEKYKDMENVFEIMLKDDKEAWLHKAFHDRRAMNAVGLALLLHKKDMIEDIINTKIKFLKEIDDPGIDWFIQFAEKVKN